MGVCFSSDAYLYGFDPLTIGAIVSAIFGAIMLMLYFSDRGTKAMLHFAIWNFVNAIYIAVHIVCILQGYAGMACYWQVITSAVSFAVFTIGVLMWTSTAVYLPSIGGLMAFVVAMQTIGILQESLFLHLLSSIPMFLVIGMLAKSFWKHSERWIFTLLLFGAGLEIVSEFIVVFVPGISGNLLLAIGVFLVSLSLLCAYYDRQTSLAKNVLGIVAKNMVPLDAS